MPIRREYRKYYRGAAWKAARQQIRERAGDCCEQCLVPNHARVARRGGYWFDEMEGVWRDPTGAVNVPPRGLPRRFVRIVCTVSHINHVPGDDRPGNLRFLCQWCHLNFDKTHHADTRKHRKDRGRPLLQEVS